MSKHLTPEDLEQIARLAELYDKHVGTINPAPAESDGIALARAFLQLYREKLYRDSEVSRWWGTVG